ncbi:hypothetical protein, unknown function [Leishmania tarentolae]|uniref:Uncharacterized protein n=1 Tax=Leishmania tarentolae TaxID=5689 RepID=A0A640KHJ9_LEITA|nr:hypothetical protein, unknown function [Leishmania tarentolae]
MTLRDKAIGALRRHQDVAISAMVLTLVLCVCVPLLVVVPGSRPYGATFIAWALAFAVRAWRVLPRERAHVRKAAHRLADARMRQRGVGQVLPHFSASSRSLPVATYTTGNGLPSCPSTEVTLRCHGLLATRSCSPTPIRQALVGMGVSGMADGSRDKTSDTAAVAAPSSSDTFLSTSALESSAQFLALSNALSRQEPSCSIADRHIASATPSGSPSVSGRHASRRLHEPFAYMSPACASDFTTLSEQGSEVPSVEPASPPFMQAMASTSRTHGCTGTTMTPASLPQTSVVGGATQSPVGLPAELTQTHLDSKTPISLCSQPLKVGLSYSQKTTFSPPTYEEAVMSSPCNSSSPRIAVLSSTMRRQSLSPAVGRAGAS